MSTTILVVDDESLFRDSIRFFLEDYDFQIEEAENGRIGIQKILDIKPDLVLIDLHMPEMTGLDVLQWVSENVPDLPIIIISGAGVIHDVAEALRRGAWDYIFKPIEDLSVLKYSIDKVLERSELIENKRHYQQQLEDEVKVRTHDLELANLEMQKKQEKILRSRVEERVLGELLQLALQISNQSKFLNKALTILTEKLLPWHGVEEGILYQFEGIGNHKNWEITATTINEKSELYKTASFVSRLEEKLASLSSEPFFSRYYDQPFLGIPVIHGEKIFAVYVLFLKKDIDEKEVLITNFFYRITDILHMSIKKYENERQIQFLAFHDILTGLANRELLMDRLEQTLFALERNNWTGILLFIDLDRFKYLNDSLGHDIGDSLLKQVAVRLKSLVRKDDFIARSGGDEFVILLTENKKELTRILGDIQEIAENILSTLRQSYVLEGHDYYLTCSIGISVFEDNSESAVDLLKHADAAMYKAKADGGNQSRFYHPEMQEAADTMLSLEKDLRIAIRNQQFHVNYQPQVSIVDNTIIGAEALIRWQHPVRGYVKPSQFISVAEDTGMILAIGEWVLEEVFAQTQKWLKMDSDGAFRGVAINISTTQFRQPDFVDQVIEQMRSFSIPHGFIKFEITENNLIENIEEIIGKMNQLKAAGIIFSIDDFGTGYSSLSYLKRLPLDQLKIDQSFVCDIISDKNDAAIVETIISMGRHLNMDVIAEGVEDQETLQRLAELGCTSYQGFLFSKAVGASEFEQLLVNGKGADHGR